MKTNTNVAERRLETMIDVLYDIRSQLNSVDQCMLTIRQCYDSIGIYEMTGSEYHISKAIKDIDNAIDSAGFELGTIIGMIE